MFHGIRPAEHDVLNQFSFGVDQMPQNPQWMIAALGRGKSERGVFHIIDQGNGPTGAAFQASADKIDGFHNDAR